MSPDRAEVVKAKLASSREQTLVFAESLADADWQRLGFAEGSEWRMIDVLRHVTDSERGMTALIVQIQGGGEGVPADFDLSRWNQRVVTKLQEKTANDLLADMHVNRQALLGVIDLLQPKDWDKKGRHASLRIMTIEEVCHLIADHEMAHIEAMRSVLEG